MRMINKKIFKFFPLIPTSILAGVFAVDLITIMSDAVIKNIYYIRNLAIIVAIVLLVPNISNLRWLKEKNIAEKIKALFFSVAGIYLAFFLLKLVLFPNISLEKQGTINIYASVNTLLFATLSSIIVTIFGIFIFLLLRDLIYSKRRRSTDRNFRFLIYIMCIQIIFLSIYKSSNAQEISLKSGGTWGAIILLLLIVTMVANSFRNTWVNYLNKQQKLACLGWGIMLLPAAYVLIGLSYHRVIMFYSVSLGIFIRQVALFLSIYWSLAILSILFHLPTAGLYDRRKREIESLHNLSRAITLEFDPDKLVGMITSRSMEVIEADGAWLEVYDPQTKKFHIASTANLNEIEQKILSTFSEKKISHWILDNRNAVIINEAARDDRTQFLQRINGSIGSLLGVPLISYEKFMGVLYAVSLEEYSFGVEDRNMLQAFADQVAIALENARLVKESIIKERLEQELKIAHDAQMKLLPKSMPRVKGLEIDAICVTANEVGGDYYDFFKFNDHQLGIVVGDVSGKGAEAAFYMAEIKGIIESLCKTTRSPKEILIKTNETLYENWDRSAFITMIFCIIDTKTKTLTCSRAGHCPLIYFNNEENRAAFIEPHGLGLGLEKGTKFSKIIEEKTITLNTEDLMLFYTDGVVEARNNFQEEFGENHLLEETAALAQLGAQDIRKKLVYEVQTFEGAAKPHDDLTLVVVKIKS
ncbi:SpoIIE family protein phosphatase [candidate division KSB1 bacterium]|nr:SpoIIE family protein phosphatase [candidate division KSB1 bacterium]